MFMKGLCDSLENLLDLEGGERLQCPVGHRGAAGLELHSVGKTREDDVASAGVVVAQSGVGSLGSHDDNENARVRGCDAAAKSKCKWGIDRAYTYFW